MRWIPFLQRRFSKLVFLARKFGAFPSAFACCMVPPFAPGTRLLVLIVRRIRLLLVFVVLWGCIMNKIPARIYADLQDLRTGVVRPVSLLYSPSRGLVFSRSSLSFVRSSFPSCLVMRHSSEWLSFFDRVWFPISSRFVWVG